MNKLLKDIYENGLYRFCDSFDTWREAVRASVAPLIERGYAREEYADKVVEMVEEYGPYICIAPHFCMPHANSPKLISRTGIAFLKTNTPVVFGDSPEEHSELFFALASPDSSSHLELMKELMEIIDDEDLTGQLLLMRSEKDLEEFFRRREQ